MEYIISGFVFLAVIIGLYYVSSRMTKKGLTAIKSMMLQKENSRVLDRQQLIENKNQEIILLKIKYENKLKEMELNYADESRRGRIKDESDPVKLEELFVEHQHSRLEDYYPIQVVRIAGVGGDEITYSTKLRIRGDDNMWYVKRFSYRYEAYSEAAENLSLKHFHMSAYYQLVCSKVDLEARDPNNGELIFEKDVLQISEIDRLRLVHKRKRGVL